MKKIWTKPTITVATLLGGIALLPGLAQATCVWDSSTSQYICSGSVPDEPNGVVSPGNVKATNRAIGQHTGGNVTQKVKNRLKKSGVNVGSLTSDQTGLAAGGSGATYGVWLNGSLADVDDSHQGMEHGSDVQVGTVGGDMWLNDKMMIGLAVSGEDIDTSTKWNAGDTETDGWTISPYAALVLNEWIAADVTLSYGWGDIDMDWNSETAHGDTDYDRMAVKGNVNFFHSILNNKIDLTTNLGLGWVSENEDSFTIKNAAGVATGTSNERGVDIGTGSVSLEGAWRGFGPLFEPFAAIGYEVDFQRDTESDIQAAMDANDEDDDNSVSFGTLGFRMNVSDTFAAELSATQFTTRENVKENSMAANLRYNF